MTAAKVTSMHRGPRRRKASRRCEASSKRSRAGGRLCAGRAVHGFSLIEAMVALVVLSVGMIGIAALHAQSLAAGRTAQLRTQAVNLAGDMADRVRVNRQGGAAYEGPAQNAQCDPQSGGLVDCTPAEMAQHELFLWEQQAARLLPEGAARIDFDGTTTPPTYTIEVSWSEVGEGTLTHQLVIRVPDF